MVRAQVTAWSERRSHAGAAVVIIGVPPSGLSCGAKLQYSHLASSRCARILVLENRDRLFPAGVRPVLAATAHVARRVPL